MTVHKLNLVLTVDDEQFDLRPYIEDAMAAGWGDDPENGMTELAESMNTQCELGCRIEWVV